MLHLIAESLIDEKNIKVEFKFKSPFYTLKSNFNIMIYATLC